MQSALLDRIEGPADTPETEAERSFANKVEASADEIALAEARLAPVTGQRIARRSGAECARGSGVRDAALAGTHFDLTSFG